MEDRNPLRHDRTAALQMIGAEVKDYASTGIDLFAVSIWFVIAAVHPPSGEKIKLGCSFPHRQQFERVQKPKPPGVSCGQRKQFDSAKSIGILDRCPELEALASELFR